jgi:hypothetical protein
MLTVNRRQVGKEVRGVRFHPPDLAGEERQRVHADTQGVTL